MIEQRMHVIETKRSDAMAKEYKRLKFTVCVYTAVYGAVTYLLFVDFNIQFTFSLFSPSSLCRSQSIVKLLISRLNGFGMYMLNQRV